MSNPVLITNFSIVSIWWAGTRPCMMVMEARSLQGGQATGCVFSSHHIEVMHSAETRHVHKHDFSLRRCVLTHSASGRHLRSCCMRPGNTAQRCVVCVESAASGQRAYEARCPSIWRRDAGERTMWSWRCMSRWLSTGRGSNKNFL